jgi:tRNA/tmRNA/rRNA uracil-C5-methylase (TrmA/RlmC/RlmD family)
MPNDYFNEPMAKGYDAKNADLFDAAVVEPAVDFLAALAREGAALELGVGTGRIALPLSRGGVRVHGIELSRAMVAELQAKPGSKNRRDDTSYATRREPDHSGRRAAPKSDSWREWKGLTGSAPAWSWQT